MQQFRGRSHRGSASSVGIVEPRLRTQQLPELSLSRVFFIF